MMSVIACVLAVGMGCETSPDSDTPDIGDPGTPGELGDSIFNYRCENRGDLKCSQTGAVDDFEHRADLRDEHQLPKAVAVGATFGIEYAGTLRDNDGSPLLVSVRPAYPGDEVSPGVYSLNQPVEAAFLATTGDGTVLDYVLQTALEPTELSIWHDQREFTSLTLAVDEVAEVTVASRSKTGTLLAGALRYSWASSDASVAAIGRLTTEGNDSSVSNQGDIVIRAVSEGTSVVRVRSGPLETTLVVEVTP